MKKFGIIQLVIAFALTAVFLPANAQQSTDVHPIVSSKFWLDAGLYYPKRGVGLSVEGGAQGGNGDFTLDKTLELGDQDPLFVGEIGWHFTENWAVSAQYFGSKNDASTTLSDVIEWDDVTYDVGVDVSAGTEFSITRIFFSRDFFGSDRHDFRLGLGVHWMDLSVFIEGQATLADFTSEFRRDSVSASAPLPNIGGAYHYSPSRHWSFGLRLDWFEASIGDISGGLINALATADYAFNDHFGMGIGYEYFTLNGDVKSDNWNGTIDIKYYGPNIFFSAYW